MSDPIVLVAVITQIGTLIGMVVAARSARGAKSAATGAKHAATAAKVAGESDHADHSEHLSTISDSLLELRRDVNGLRSDDREMRRELHDHDQTLRAELHGLRVKLNRHLGLGE